MKMNETIRTRRKELNLTQEQMAACLGVTAPAVHKWEKGMSYPDVSILPALARLLKMDLNTLFSFEKELTEQEISLFSSEALAVMQAEGFEAGYEMIMAKVREFPTCASLMCNMASSLDGALTLFQVENPEQYAEEIEDLYARAIEHGDSTIRNNANYMLILRYIRRDEFDKAEELWETLPENPLDKKNLKAVICLRRKKHEEAVRIFEEKLWEYANNVQSALSSLALCFLQMKKDNLADLCAQKVKEVTDVLGLWDYGSSMIDFQLAVARKDREKTLASLRWMFESMQAPRQREEFPLYGEIAAEVRSGEAMRLMLPTLTEAIKKENGLDGEGFLQGDEELEKLLEEFGSAGN